MQTQIQQEETERTENGLLYGCPPFSDYRPSTAYEAPIHFALFSPLPPVRPLNKYGSDSNDDPDLEEYW